LGFVVEVMVWRGVADPGAAGDFAQGEGVHADLCGEFSGGLNQCLAQVAVVVGFAFLDG
jgi:hypothetical protein